MRTLVKNFNSQYVLLGTVCFVALSALLTPCIAEQLPIKTYSTADGLARDGILHIYQDSRGFLWFSTPDGISRFDGYEFTNYGIEEGLPHRIVNAMLETRSGVYWMATAQGLCRFNPNGVARKSKVAVDSEHPDGLDAASTDSMFVIYHFGANRNAESVNALFEDRAGTVWCGTSGGLYRIEEHGKQWTLRFVKLNSEPHGGADIHITSVLEDRRGALWLGTMSGLYRRATDGSTQNFTTAQGLPDSIVRQLLMDNTGQLWAGTSLGLCQLGDVGSGPLVQRILTTKDGLPGSWVSALYQTSDGTIWVGLGSNGLVAFDPQAPMNKSRYVSYTTDNGLSDRVITAMMEDRAGNLWLGSESGGVMKLAHSGLTTYREADGLQLARIASIFANQQGTLFVVNSDPTAALHRFDGRRFSDVVFRLPLGVVRSWGWDQVSFEDHTGEWWIPTAQGLYRYGHADARSFSRQMPKAVYTTREGLATNEVFRLYEDRHGDIWISTLGNPRDALAKWERATGKFHRYRMMDGLPESAPTAFSEDSAGNLWIGFYGGGLARFRDRHFELFTTKDGLPAGMIRGLHTDRLGRLWIAADEGLGRLDETSAARPPIIRYTTAEGLVSDHPTCVTEDAAGNIYVGTVRGLDQLDPESGRIRHYTQKDGLANDYVNVAFRDRTGALWFGTMNGLSRLWPEKELAVAPPNINLRRLSIAGVRYQLSELGADLVPELQLAAGQNHLQIDFMSVGFEPGESLRYQYMLEGADTGWSAPTEQRSLTFANLQPGAYRFLVRAVSANGATSERPATITFRIMPPFWRRGWFVTLIALLAATVIYILNRRRRLRLKVLRESENRFRTLAETASDAIITIDENSTIIFVNAAAESVFGYSLAELVGANLTLLMPEYLRHLHQAGISRYVETGQRHIGWEAAELPGVHKSGREIPLELSFGEFTKDGRRYFTGIARDITERKRTEEALLKAKEERFTELRRVRSSIATNLHDDIGSSLTQIAILGEVVQQQMSDSNAPATENLTQITSVSNDLIEAMSDIVWAINPEKDQLNNLIQRMRRFAHDVFTARQVEFSFRAPGPDEDVHLGANIRREVFLIYKESVNNMVKHSHCRDAEIEFQIKDEWLSLRVSDNGIGFDPSLLTRQTESDIVPEKGGNGMLNMQRRAAALGGEYRVESRPAQGTTVILRAPLARSQPTNGENRTAHTGGDAQL